MPLVRSAILILVLNLLAASGLAGENMIGRQSQNEGISVLPAPARVTVDGDLDEWDLSGRIWVFADEAVRNRYSAEVSAMWDKQNLYLAARWHDPTPMFSAIDPEVNASEGWKSDSWQVRFRTNDIICHATMWYFAEKKMPVLHMNYGRSLTEPFKGEQWWVGKAGGTELGRGIELAYKPWADGKGFDQEVKIPWAVLCVQVPDWQAGQSIQMGMEFLWGDPTGKQWPVHRYADNLQPGLTSREFFWTAWKSWGQATLLDRGNVPVRRYVSDAGVIDGTIPVRVTVPAAAARFTIVLDTPDGERIRTLAADCDPLNYTVEEKDGQRLIEVKWDGLDDWGQPVAAGSFEVRALSHRGLGAEYDMTFYDPGTPPWPTRDGSGAWGADHTSPNNVAAAGEWMIVTCPLAEGGSGIWGLDETGRKRWSDRRGVGKVAANAKYAFAWIAHWYTDNTLCRFDARNGKPAPFVLDGQPRLFDLPIAEILGAEPPGDVTGMAASGETLAVAFQPNLLVLLDAASAAVKARFELTEPGDLAFAPDGSLLAASGGKLVRIDPATGAQTPLATPGLGRLGAIAADAEGNAVVIDSGPDCQVKAYRPDGTLAYTAARQGGRPDSGPFDAQAISHPSSVAVDHQGRIWVTELWDFPRRVSVWGSDGKLVRDYVGNTGYAGTGAFLHDQDPGLGYVGPIEIRLDRQARTWAVERVLWVPPGDRLNRWNVTKSHIGPQRFTATLDGQTHEYLYFHDTDLQWGTGHLVLMERGNRFQPVAAISLVAHFSGGISRRSGEIEALPEGELAGLNPYDAIVWADANGDGTVQRPECQVISTPVPGSDKKRGQPALRLGNGWGGRLGTDLSIYMADADQGGLMRWKPARYVEGAPVYAIETRTVVTGDGVEDIVPVPGEESLITLSRGSAREPGKLAVYDLATGRQRWAYPNLYHSVHGSHKAPMAQPGLLIGPLKTCGVAHIGDAIGSVFLIRGNLGQDFLYTTDGLMVGTLFQDCRLPNEALPPREEQLRGVPLEGYSEGGEPFSGWFGKQSDGKIRLATSLARQACMVVEVKGLDSIERTTGPTVSLSQELLAQALADNARREVKSGGRPTAFVAPLAAAPRIDGDSSDWPALEAIHIQRQGQPDFADVRLGHRDAMLYVAFDVRDATPWKNEGRDLKRLFKTGDAVDLTLGLVPPNGKPHGKPEAGDVRILIARGSDGKPVAIRMAPVDQAAPREARTRYTSPVGTVNFDRVEPWPAVQVAVKAAGDRYCVEAAIPLAELGIEAAAGLKLFGDMGFISSNAEGTENMARTYWANPHTNLVNDLPQEAVLTPTAWGMFEFK